MKKHYSLDKMKELILHENVRVAMIDGGRDIGKSTAVKLECLEQAWKSENNKFIYMRRFGTDISKFLVEHYFQQPFTTKYIKKLTRGKYDRIIYKSRVLYFGTLDPDNDYKEVLGKVAGYCIPVAEDKRHKSLGFEDVQYVIYEEWQTYDRYLPDEVKKLMSILSTIMRDRTDVCIFMVANLINDVSPYSQEFGLSRIMNQKPNTIDIYKDFTYRLEGGGTITFSIAREFCGEVANVNKRDIEVSYYNTREYPTYEYYRDKTYHLIVIEYGQFKFIMRLIKIDNALTWYVSLKTTDIKPNTRVIGNVYHPGSLYTRRMTALNDKERYAFELYQQGRVVYSDCLTAERFNTAIRELCI